MPSIKAPGEWQGMITGYVSAFGYFERAVGEAIPTCKP
jgi:hypothetical protein